MSQTEEESLKEIYSVIATADYMIQQDAYNCYSWLEYAKAFEFQFQTLKVIMLKCAGWTNLVTPEMEERWTSEQNRLLSSRNKEDTQAGEYTEVILQYRDRMSNAESFAQQTRDFLEEIVSAKKRMSLTALDKAISNAEAFLERGPISMRS